MAAAMGPAAGSAAASAAAPKAASPGARTSTAPPGAPSGGRRPRRTSAQARQHRAYELGRKGRPLPDDLAADADAAGAYGDGANDAAQDGPAAPKAPAAAPAAPSAPAKSSSRVKPPSGGGFVLGILAYALVLNYLQGGPTQVRRWLAAKFVNRTGDSPSGSGGKVSSSIANEATRVVGQAQTANATGTKYSTSPPPTSGSPLEPVGELVPLRDYSGTVMRGMWLVAPAAAAFQRAQQIFGSTIPLTGAYRTAAVEQAGHDRDPAHFPPVSERSYHVRGMAIDVWAAQLQRGQTPPANDPRIISALEQAGFQRFDPTNKRGEAMHWSFGVRG